MLEIHKDDFKAQVLDSDVPVLVDFMSSGCGPCRMLGPILEGAELKIPNVKFVKINASEGDNVDIFSQYSVSYVPTLILFKNGQDVERKNLMSEKELVEWLV